MYLQKKSYKELARVLMAAEKFQDLQLASWRSKREMV